MVKKVIIFFLAAVFFVGSGFLLAKYLSGAEQQGQIVAPVQPQSTQTQKINQQENLPSQSVQSNKDVQLKVPFIVQAPFGNWSDPVFQNACEESSIVMAMGWLKGTAAIAPQDAQAQILDIVAYENKAFGYNADTNVFDVQKIFSEHFQHNVSVKENISLSDIITELQKGNLVLVPAFGQALVNPNYTPPGPIAHMLVVTGYDSQTHQFITNDPGTKHGASYRYNENVLFGAIWEYPSGNGPLQAPAANASMVKAMVVVSK